MVLTIYLTLWQSLSVGLISGIALSVLYLIYLWSHPNIKTEMRTTKFGHRYCEIIPDKGMYFPAVDMIHEKILINCEQKCPIILNCTHFSGLDFTSLKGFNLLTKDVQLFDQQLILYKCAPHLVSNANKISIFKNIVFCADEDELEDQLKPPDVTPTTTAKQQRTNDN